MLYSGYLGVILRISAILLGICRTYLTQASVAVVPNIPKGWVPPRDLWMDSGQAVKLPGFNMG